ncbi:MAG: hypothetical protein VB118_07710 [Oscillospiraceae bacterium]|nr:hypothetical protein [Oscillospiraceae bacterium]
MSGDALTRHRQKLVKDGLYSIIFSLRNIKTIQARNIEEQIIKLFIPDENYLHFHAVLFECLMEKVSYLLQDKRYDDAIISMQEMLYHAKKYDNITINTSIYKYTAPFFDMLEVDSNKFIRTGTSTQTEDFYEWLNNQQFDPIRERVDFKKLNVIQ